MDNILALSEEDIKLRYITPSILQKGWSVEDITMETKVKLTMGHRTKRIRWWRVEKLVKSLVYKELCVVWWLRLHKTKRLHWFNFGLPRRAFRLHEAGERFTYIGLHVYACGLFCCCAWKFFIQGHLGRTGALYAPKINRVGMVLERP